MTSQDVAIALVILPIPLAVAAYLVGMIRDYKRNGLL